MYRLPDGDGLQDIMDGFGQLEYRPSPQMARQSLLMIDSLTRLGLLVCSLLFVAVLSACAGDAPTPVAATATPTPSFEPTESPSLAVGPEVGDLAPEFELTTVNGETLALSDLSGYRPFILYFFATW